MRQPSFINLKQKLLDWSPILILASIVILHAPLHSSFWLDEAITAWLIFLPENELISESLKWQAQSPLYFYLLSKWVKLFGNSSQDLGYQYEYVLRLFSLACFILSLFISTLLVKSLVNHSSSQKKYTNRLGILTCVILLSSEDLLRAAFSARPYSVAFLFSLLSTLFFLKLISNPNKVSLTVYSVTLLLTYYFHYLFVGIGIVHLAILIGYLRLNNSNQIKSVIVYYVTTAWSITIVGMIPGIAHELQWSAKADKALDPINLSSIAYRLFNLTVSRQFFVYIPVTLILVGLIHIPKCKPLEWWLNFKSFVKRDISRVAVIFLIAPVLLLLGASVLLGHNLLISRYALWGIIGVAILMVSIILPFAHTAALTTAIWVWSGFASTFETERKWRIEDWREAAFHIEKYVNKNNLSYSQVSVFINSGLREGNFIAYLSDKKAWPYLSVPFTVYIPRVNLIPIPTKLLSEYPLDVTELWAQQLLAKSQVPSEVRHVFIASPKRYSQLAYQMINSISKQKNNGAVTICDTANFGLVDLLRICI